MGSSGKSVAADVQVLRGTESDVDLFCSILSMGGDANPGIRSRCCTNNQVTFLELGKTGQCYQRRLLHDLCAHGDGPTKDSTIHSSR